MAQDVTASSRVLIPAYRSTAVARSREASWLQDRLQGRLGGRQSHLGSEASITLEVTRWTRVVVPANSGTAIISDSNYTSLFQGRVLGCSRIKVATVVEVICVILAEQCNGHIAVGHCHGNRGMLVWGRFGNWP